MDLILDKLVWVRIRAFLMYLFRTFTWSNANANPRNSRKYLA